MRNRRKGKWEPMNERFAEMSRVFENGDRLNEIEAQRCGWRRSTEAWRLENGGCERGDCVLGFQRLRVRGNERD
jgi:hypothetical protein